MKYLLSIVSLLAAITAITLFFNWPEQQDVSGDAVVTINGRTINKQYFQSHKAPHSNNADNRNDINAIITRQLLIAEAQRRHIDLQPEFRLALQTLYEDSLINLLLDQVKDEVKITVNSDELNNYIQSFGKTFTFYILQNPQPVTVGKIVSEGTKYTSRFDELGSRLKQSLAVMSPGETTTTYDIHKEKIAIHLEKIEGVTTNRTDFDKKKVKELLQKIKAEKQVNAWIDSLRDQAVITYHINQE